MVRFTHFAVAGLVVLSITLTLSAYDDKQLSAQEVVSNHAASEFRHWTTADGQRSGTRLKLVVRNKSSVRLQREDNGKIVTFPLARLSTDDRAFLRSRADSSTGARQNNAVNTDWPQWRGVSRDGKSASTGLLEAWPVSGPKLLWQIDGLGEGY